MDKQLRGSVAIAVRVAVVAVAIMLVTAVATGWLYWMRAGVAHWPGPRMADALPLDELPGHDGVPLVVYLAVFAVAGVMLGLAARAVRMNRLTAGVSLAAGTVVWLLVVDVFCLLVVRQVPTGEAFRAAAKLPPVYVAAALAGAGGALLGRGGRPGGLTPRLLGWLVAAGGVIDLVSALIPHLAQELGAARVVSPAAHVLLVPAGVLLLIATRGLARGNRRAWGLATGLLGLSVLLQLLRGPNYAAAIVAGLVGMALIARRDDFSNRGDPAARPSALLRLLGTLLFAMVYGVTALWVYRTSAGLPFNAGQALRDTFRAMGRQLPSDIDLLPSDFAEWFPVSVLSIVAIGVCWAATVWLRPWRQRLFPDARLRGQASDIVRRWGSDTLAPFTLRSDKEWFITGQTLIAYRVVRGIALVSGDPVGPPEEAGPALERFLAHAQARGWRTAVMGASDQLLPTYRNQGLHPVYHGDEAVIDTQAFSLDGRSMRATRQATHRLERKGFRAEVMTAGDVSPALRAELATVERAWLRGGARKGFTMELDSLFRLDGDDAVFVIGWDENDRISGFLHLAVCRPSQSLSLSTMPRWRDAPNGLTAWLIVETVSWARDKGLTHVSLNFSPFAGLLAGDGELPRMQRLQRRALLRLKGILALQLDNLLRFNAQFNPVWQARYVILQAWTDLPRVAVAAMAAEGYLPHATLIRGRGWLPGPDQALVAEPPAAETWVADGPAGEEPAGKEPAGKEPAGKEPAGKEPAGKEPRSNGLTGNGPAANGPAANGPAAKEPAPEPGAAARGEVPAGRGRHGPL
jgi:lysyl-tRNA synthetase, class II